MKKKWTSRFLAAVVSLSMVMPGSVTAWAAPVNEEAQTKATQTTYDGEYAQGEALVKVKDSFYQQNSITSSGARIKSQEVTFDTLIDIPAEETEAAEGGASTHEVLEDEQILLAKSENLSTEELIASLEAYDGVEYAEPNYKITTQSTGTEDPYLEEQWHLKDQGRGENQVTGGTNVSSIWTSGVTGSSGTDEIVVGILDTGIDYTHEDLVSNIDMSLCEDFSGDYYRDDDDFYRDENENDVMDHVGHGTHVAGIIGACGENGIGVSGMNKQITLSALQVLGNDGNGYVSAGIEAYSYMINKKYDGVNYVAANNSWGGSSASQSLQDAVDYAGTMGIVSVFSSGNESDDRDTCAAAPTGGTEMSLTVNASDRNAQVADFSDFGQVNTTLYAPGVNVYSTVITEGSSYDDTRPEFHKADLSKLSSASIKAYETDPAGDVVEGTPDVEVMPIKDDKLSWNIQSTTEDKLDYNMGVEIQLGDYSAYKEYPYLALKGMVEDSQNSQTGRYAYIEVKRTDGFFQVIGENVAFLYGTEGKMVLDLSDVASEVNWNNLTIRISRFINVLDISQTLTFTLSQIGVIDEIIQYGLMSGTSMASPVVTGAVALLAAKYEQPKKATEEEKTEVMREISARITGGVTRLGTMKEKCVSGGYLNLEKAVTDPYPVLQNFTQDGSQAVIDGYFFGTAKGTLSMDGEPIDVTEWTDHRITFTLKNGTKEGLHEFKVQSKDGQTEYGRGWFDVEKVEGTTTAADTLYEKLPTPDYESMNLDIMSDDLNYTSAALDGKIYVTAGHIFKYKNTDVDDTYYPVILIYDENTKEWSPEVLTELPYSMSNDVASLQIISGKDLDKIYLLEKRYNYQNGASNCNIYQYEPDASEDNRFNVVKEKHDIEFLSDSTVLYDSGSIWMIGGWGSADTGVVSSNRVMKYDISKEEWTKMPPLNTARYSPVACVAGGKLVVTGGLDSDSHWISQTEIWNEQNCEWEISTQFPEVYKSQSISTASGSYGDKIVVTGMFKDEAHTADTYVFDTKTNTWTASDKKVNDTKVHYSTGAISGDYFYVYGETLVSNNAENGFYRVKTSDLLVNKKPQEQPSTQPSTQPPTTGTTAVKQPIEGSKAPAVGEKIIAGSITYAVTSNKEVKVLKITKKNQTKAVIPATVTWKGQTLKVTSIGQNAFAGSKKLKKVVIGKNIKTIGKKAFYKCKSLKTIEIKTKVLTKVGAKAFSGIARKATWKLPKAKKTKYKRLLGL